MCPRILSAACPSVELLDRFAMSSLPGRSPSTPHRTHPTLPARVSCDKR